MEPLLNLRRRDLFAVGVRGYLAVNDDLIQYLPLAVDAVLMHSQDREWHLDPIAHHQTPTAIIGSGRPEFGMLHLNRRGHAMDTLTEKAA